MEYHVHKNRINQNESALPATTSFVVASSSAKGAPKQYPK